MEQPNKIEMKVLLNIGENIHRLKARKKSIKTVHVTRLEWQMLKEMEQKKDNVMYPVKFEDGRIFIDDVEIL